MTTAVRDRGQSAVTVLLVAVALFVPFTAATVIVGGGMIERSRAQTAADAAALAWVTGGRAAAEQLAQRHGATVVGFRTGPGAGQVTVIVRIGGATATAAATDAP
jgi:hypothetical protein